MEALHRGDMQGNIFVNNEVFVTKSGFLEVSLILNLCLLFGSIK